MAQPPIPGSRPTGRGRARIRRASAVVLAAVLAASCTGPSEPDETAAAPSTTVPPIEAPAQLPDTRDVALAAAVGTPVPADAPTVRGGDADLVGIVEGPDGPVPGAEVLLERFVGDQRASLVVRTDKDGRYRALKVFGGRYRIRAWKAPELALTQPVLQFVRDDEETVIDLRLTRHDGLTVQAVVSRSSALVGDTVTITALVTDETVDERGIVVAPAAVGEAVDLDLRGPWALDGAPRAVADGDGRVTWTATCEQPGSGVFSVTAGEAAPASVSTSCADPPEEPEEPTGDPPPDPDFPVGDRFSAPYAPPLPAGSYEVVQDPGSCGVTFERYVDGAWEGTRRTATGTIGFDVPTPFRDVRLLGGSAPCLYERVS